MFRKIVITSILLTLTSHLLSAQGFAANLGYNYIGKNAGFLGVEYRINDTHKPSINLGIGSYLTSVNDKFGFVPEIHYNQTFDKNSGLAFQLSASTKNLKPSINFNLLNIIRLDLGYSFGYKSSKDFQGLAFGINILLGQDEFYDYFNIMR